METVVVTPDNVAQVVQALFENVKSNQHRLDEIEPVLKQIASDTGELTTLLVRNGFSQAVKDNAKEIKAFRGEFQAFLFKRGESCPTAKKLNEEKQKRSERRDWGATLTRIGIALLALIPTALLVIDRIGG